jgi:hypothetical protein
MVIAGRDAMKVSHSLDAVDTDVADVAVVVVVVVDVVVLDRALDVADAVEVVRPRRGGVVGYDEGDAEVEARGVGATMRRTVEFDDRVVVVVVVVVVARATSLAQVAQIASSGVVREEAEVGARLGPAVEVRWEAVYIASTCGVYRSGLGRYCAVVSRLAKRCSCWCCE